MRTSFFFFSLLCALPVLCHKYHIHSQDPDRYIYSDGMEKPGDLVKTVGKVVEGYPPYTVVTIDAPISDTEPTTGPIACKVGKLFICLNKERNKLEWKTDPCSWTFNPGTEYPFHVISLPDESKIWLDSVYDRGVVEVVEAPIKIGDAFWRIDKA